MPEQRTANVQWSRTVEVVKASQPHFIRCLCMSLYEAISQRHWTGRQMFCFAADEIPVGKSPEIRFAVAVSTSKHRRLLEW